MKLKKYIAASMIALAGLTACSDSFLDTDYTEYLDEEAAGEAAGKNPDVFLNGMWSWMVTFGQTSTSHDDFGYMGHFGNRFYLIVVVFYKGGVNGR